MTAYEDFIASKRVTDDPSGFPVDRSTMPAHLYDWQADVVEWTLARGRAAVFLDTGMGKTIIQAAWAQAVQTHTRGRVLILAPLGVVAQTIREAHRHGVDVQQIREAGDADGPGVWITNYERVERFDDGEWDGLVLDESSILKNYSGSTRQALTDFAAGIRYRLACTATPAPNDVTEIANHAEFLSVMRRDEIMALFFTQDGNTTQKWRLKGHARRPFYRWLASWAVAARKPSDLGGSNDGFDLPDLRITQHMVEPESDPSETLFPVEAQTLSERRSARRDSLSVRAEAAADLIAAEPDESWIVWCDFNAESESIARLVPGAVEVRGSDDPDDKAARLLAFSDGEIRVLVTKPSIAGFGMNWQHCARVLFVGLSDSFEQFYQAIRRCHRYGQERQVHVHVITSPAEGAVVRNIERKQHQVEEMMSEIVSAMEGYSLGQSHREDMTYETDDATGDGWRLMLGDSIERVQELDSESIDLSVFSPPFPGMYVYTNSPRDMGNAATIGELMAQYRYLAPELYRITKPGRSCCVHLTQGIASKWKDGFSGRRDFRGQVIEAMEDAGWILYGEVTIDKDPQLKAIRTKDRGLLFKSLANDSSVMRMAMADYLIQFVKPGDSQVPIRAGISEKYGNPDGWITQAEWIEWAAPVWYRQTPHYPGGIRESDVLNASSARSEQDERHLCPLQLGVIERCVKLWTNPGETVFSPFAGIGSEGYESLQHRRRFVGCELKRSYYETAKRNLAAAVVQPSILEPVA